MSRLFLRCGLCGRQQADGLLSRGYWGHLELGNGTALRACPTCKEQHSDWEMRLRAATGAVAADESALGPSYGTAYGVGA
ncbi:MAG TPA: hypothetical protein VHF23_08590 [Gaiellaceae bacterium]|nr:hypothetical protein [Gaiellaceae bacterium]